MLNHCINNNFPYRRNVADKQKPQIPLNVYHTSFQ